MILVAGASGQLGREVVRQLVRRGLRVRAMTRVPAKLADLRALGVEVMQADLRSPLTLSRAMHGVSRVLMAAHAFGVRGQGASRVVDDRGNRMLVDVAFEEGARQVVLVSSSLAHPQHPIDFFRHQARLETYVQASMVPWAILRPSPLMEDWLGRLRGRSPLVVAGRGRNPVNLVSVRDVAAAAVNILSAPVESGRVVDVCGPDNLSLNEMLLRLERHMPHHARVVHVPRGVVWAAYPLLRWVHAGAAHQLAFTACLDAQVRARYPEPQGLHVRDALQHVDEIARQLTAP